MGSSPSTTKTNAVAKKATPVKKGIPKLSADEKVRLRTYLDEEVLEPLFGTMIPNGRVDGGTDKYDISYFTAGIPILKRLVKRSLDSNGAMTIKPSEYEDLLEYLGLDSSTVDELAANPDMGRAAIRFMEVLEKHHEGMDDVTYDYFIHWGGNLTPCDLTAIKDNDYIGIWQVTPDSSHLRGKPLRDFILDEMMPKLETDAQFRAHYKYRVAEEDASYKLAEQTVNGTPQINTSNPPPTTTPVAAPTGMRVSSGHNPIITNNQTIEDLFDLNTSAVAPQKQPTYLDIYQPPRSTTPIAKPA